MDEAFDPYRKWLGIPPEEQPPHYYRLLGLELFEGDADVIVNAADARLTFLLSFAKDRHADMAERLAAQIKEVQACLLDPAKKAFYDGQLQRRIAALKKSPPALASSSTTRNASPPMHASPAGGMTAPQAAPSGAFALPQGQVPTYSKVAARPNRKQWPQLAAAFFGLIAVGVVLIFLLVKYNAVDDIQKNKNEARAVPRNEKERTGNPDPNSKSNEIAKVQPVVKPNTPRDNGETNPFREKETSVVSPFKESSDISSKPLINSGGDTVDNGDWINGPLINALGKNDRNGDNPKWSKEPGGQSTSSQGNGHPVGGGDEPSSFGRESGKPLAIPTETARQSAEKTVREIFGIRIAAAKSGPEKRALSVQIWQQATENDDDPVARYVMMNIAYQLIADSGQLQRALQLVDSFARRYEVDPWELKLQATAKAVQAARNNTPEVNADELVILSRQFAEEARDAGQLDIAAKAVKAVIPLAKAKKDPLLISDLNTLNREIDQLKARFQPVRKALDTLKERPDDPDANLVAGRWLSFETRDWDKGLPLLSKSSDAALTKLATEDLAAAKETADRQLEVADAWWEFGQKAKAPIKAGVLARAEYWYDRTLPDLTGIKRTKAEERLKSIAGGDTAAAGGRGVIQAGNVALAKNGTRVEGVRTNADKLFDGRSENPSWDGGAANSPVPCEWTITFDKVYQLQEVRFHFFNGDARFYQYAMAISADGTNYKMIAERKIGQWFDWQRITFSARPVKSIKLYGTFSYRNRVFSVTEFEAYCIPPKP